MSFRKHSQVFSSLDETRGTPAFGKRLARLFLPDKEFLKYRESWSIGQNIQTPADLDRDDLILDDIPYVGMLGWANTFSAFDDRSYTGFEWLFGWVGEATQAEVTQKAAHRLTGSTEPKGWDNQLDNEPILNLYFAKKRKLWRSNHFDAAVGADVAVGNFFTHAQTALEMRFGNLPYGFVDVPTPIGRGISSHASLHIGSRAYTYGSIVVRGTRLLHALPRDGNVARDNNPWTERNQIDREDLVGQLIIGAHVVRPTWGVHLNIWLSTDTIAEEGLTDNEDPANNFVVITFERRL